jgi:hypothetical protein
MRQTGTEIQPAACLLLKAPRSDNSSNISTATTSDDVCDGYRVSLLTHDNVIANSGQPTIKVTYAEMCACTRTCVLT